MVRKMVSPNENGLILLATTLLTLCSLGVAQRRLPLHKVTPETISHLETRRVELEHELATYEALKEPKATSQLRQLQEALLKATAQEDDARQALPENSKSAQIVSTLSVPVFYATDRQRMSSGGFGASLRREGLQFGRATAIVSTSYPVRTDYLPGASNLKIGTADSVQAISPISTTQIFLDQLAQASLGSQGRKLRVLLFVHGYNVTFDQSVSAAARLATSLDFPVIPVVYSWPSAGNVAGYWHDEDTVRASFPKFMALLQEMASRSSVEMVLVCHSMGSREVTSALAEIGRNHLKLPALHKVIYAAADISIDDFRSAWPGLANLQEIDYAFYVSNHDLPLKLSHIVHHIPRLGDGAPPVFIPTGGTTIDASMIDSVWQAWGHSYILKSQAVGVDVGAWVDAAKTPLQRNLHEVNYAGGHYFQLR